MTYDSCKLRAHYEREVIDKMLDDWSKADPRARTHYDVMQCRRCHRWYVQRRPDWGDAA